MRRLPTLALVAVAVAGAIDLVRSWAAIGIRMSREPRVRVSSILRHASCAVHRSAWTILAATVVWR